MEVELHRSLNSALISKSKKILDILLLGNKEAIKGRRNLNLKKVAKRTKIRHKKLTMTSLHKGNVLRIVVGDDRHIEEFAHELKCRQKVQDHEHTPKTSRKHY